MAEIIIGIAIAGVLILMLAMGTVPIVIRCIRHTCKEIADDWKDALKKETKHG